MLPVRIEKQPGQLEYESFVGKGDRKIFDVFAHPALSVSGGIAIATTSAILLQQLYQRKKWQSLYQLPSPPQIWPLGHLTKLVLAAKDGQFSQQLLNWAHEYNGKYLIWLLNRPVVIFTNPKTIETMLMEGQANGTLTRSPSFYNAYAEVFGPHVGNQTGPEWRWQRQAIVPPLKLSRFASKVNVILEACNSVVDRVSLAVRTQETICIDPLFVELTMGVITYFLVGNPLDEEATSDDLPPYESQQLYAALGELEKEVLLISATSNKLSKVLPKRKKKSREAALQVLHNFLDRRIELALEIASDPQGEAAAAYPLLAQSILVHLAKSPNHTAESLFATTIAVLFAGHDTTAHTLSFAVGELGLNSNAFQAARAEVDRLWERDGRLHAETLDELVYVGAVIKETMRLRPVVPGIPLITTRDTEIEGMAIPAGTGVEPFFFAARLDAEMYPQPEQFVPERWLEPTSGSNSPQPIMFGFSLGAHYCVGASLAILESKVMLALLLRQFEWTLENGRQSLEQLDQHLTLFPRDRMPLRFTQRKGAYSTV